MKDILFLCQFFYPEYNSSATLPFDTAEYLANNGYSVDAMCGYPKEYTKQKGLPLKERVNGVGIRRLRYLQPSRGGKLGRLINYFSFTLAALLHIGALRNYRAVIVYSNPPVLPIVPIIANALLKTKFIFVAYDIYPEVAYASNSLKRGGMIDKAMRAINRRLYKRASKIVTLTEEMRQFVLEHRPEADASRACVIPNWAHEGTAPATKEAYQRFGYNEGDFIVSYFGNMGVCQDTETMLEAMRMLKDDEEIQFLIAGHGSKLPALKGETEGFRNVRIMDFLLDEEFEQALAISSCGIVSLEKGLTGTCAPSKYYSYLQSGCPVIAIADEGSYLSKDVEQEQIGCHVNAGDGEELVRVLKALCADRHMQAEMAQRASAAHENNYAKPIAMKEYCSVISAVLGGDEKQEGDAIPEANEL